MKYHYKLVNCKKIIQKCVSIYETNECDIGIPDIHRSFRRLTVVNGTPGIGASQIHVGETHELFWRVTQQIHLGGLLDLFISEGCPQLKQIFLLKTIFIHGISMCEGVSDDSRHGIGHVHIQVGSCFCLNVFGCHFMCT